MSASSTKPAVLALLALAFLLNACQFNVGTVEAHLVYTNNPDRDPLDRDIVRTLRLRIEGDGMDSMETEFSLISGDSKALTDVPLGKNRILTIEGLDTAGNVRSRGVSAPFSTRSGKTKVYIYFSLVEKFSDPPSVFQEEEWNSQYRTDMTVPRAFHTTTLLPDDTVLVVGGTTAPVPGDYLGRVSNADRTAERFMITPCAFILEKEPPDCTSGRLCMRKEGGRAHHSAELLPGGTHVVVAGGEPVDSYEEWPAEYYCIETRSFESKIGMINRTRHASAVLTGSREGLVIAGGEGQLASDLLGSIELFEAGDFENLSPKVLSVPRTGAVAVAFPDLVVFIGGWTAPNQTSSVVDVIHFDQDPPEIDSFDMHYERAGHTAVVGDLGAVHVCGGLRYVGGVPEVVEYCEALNPEAKTSTEYTGIRRWGHTATILQDGRMLLAGGFSSMPPTLAENSAVLFDTPVGTGSRKTIPMVSKRVGHTATLLSNGMVVLIGGVSSADTVEPASQDYEIFNPRPQ